MSFFAPLHYVSRGHFAFYFNKTRPISEYQLLFVCLRRVALYLERSGARGGARPVVTKYFTSYFVKYVSTTGRGSLSLHVFATCSAVRSPTQTKKLVYSPRTTSRSSLCSGRGSNPHPFRDRILSSACIPVPPPEPLYLNVLSGGTGGN